MQISNILKRETEERRPKKTSKCTYKKSKSLGRVNRLYCVLSQPQKKYLVTEQS